MLACALTASLALTAYVWFGRIQTVRVNDARQGKNLAR
jgi:hypothetical protein